MSGCCARLCRLNDLLKSYEQLEEVIPACLLPVFKPYLKRAERVLQPGVTTHGWTALVIDDCTYVGLRQSPNHTFISRGFSPVPSVSFLPALFPLFPRFEVAPQDPAKGFERALLAPLATKNAICSHQTRFLSCKCTIKHFCCI